MRISDLIKQQDTRIELAKKSLDYFLAIYFTEHIRCDLAPFQKEILELLQDESIPMICITSFRGSGKSTLCTLIYALWCAIRDPHKKYILIICHNQMRATEALDNLVRETERNSLLINDFGPFQEQSDPNNNNAIVLGKYGVKIGAASISEGIRGTKFGAYRPDLIICDDLEDVQTANTKESRDKTWQLVNGEIIPLSVGSNNARIIFIGNLVHHDSTLKRLQNEIEDGRMKGVYKEYRIIDPQGKPTWPGLYPSLESIDLLRSKIGSEIDYRREFMLEPMPEGGQIVTLEMIHSYKVLPTENLKLHLISIDPAFSVEPGADNSAILEISIFGYGKDTKLYVHQFPFNKKVQQPELVEEIKRRYKALSATGITKILVEKAGQQQGLIDTLVAEGLPAEAVSIGNHEDKRYRLNDASFYIKSVRVLFAEKNNEDLITQTIFFGTERYDDLVDALTLAIRYFIQVLSEPGPKSTMVIIGGGPFSDGPFGEILPVTMDMQF